MPDQSGDLVKSSNEGFVVERELMTIEWEKKSLQVLTESRSNRMALLSYAIREELLSHIKGGLFNFKCSIQHVKIFDTLHHLHYYINRK